MIRLSVGIDLIYASFLEVLVNEGIIFSTDNLLLCKMENEEDGQSQSTKRIIEIFSEFMMRITKFEELVSMGNKFLICFHQALGFLRRPPIEKTSSSVEQIIKAHDSRRVLSYFDAGCMNAHDCVQNVSKSKSVVTELQALLDDAALAVQNAREKDEDASHYLDSLITLNAQEEVSSSSDLSKLEVIEYAGMMAAIYSMVQQDFTMQDRIVSSLSLKSQQGELETYCQMWSLRPYVDDHIMLKAWSLVR